MSLISRFAFVLFCVCVFICLLYAFLMLYILFFFFFFSSCLFFFCIYTFFTISFFRSICLCVCLFLSLNALTLFLVIIFRLVSSFIDVAFVKSFKFPFFTGLVFRILVPTFFKRLFQRVSYLSASKAQRNAIDKLVCPQQNKI